MEFKIKNGVLKKYNGKEENVVIPEGVTSIGHRAFDHCNSLTINCDVASQPSGWSSDWNPDKRPVNWGYKG